MRMVTEAIEKATPRRPKAITSGSFGVCPRCENLVSRYEEKTGNREIRYCKWCGQALAWSDPAAPMNQ